MILTQQSTKILGIIATVIAVVIGVMLVILPAFDAWSENNESISQAESEVGLMQSQRDGFLQAQQMYPNLSEIDSMLRVRFPEIADNDGIIVELSRALSSSGINANSLTLTFAAPEVLAPTFEAPAPAPEPAPVDGEEPAPTTEAPVEATPAQMGDDSISDMAKMDVSISVEGTDTQIAEFLEVLHGAERAIVVKQFSVQSNAETGVSQLAITSEVYIFARIPNPGVMQEAEALPEGEEPVSDDVTGEATT